MKTVVLVLVLFAFSAAVGLGQVAPPPGEKPVEVFTSFYLLNLNSVDEKTETFEADIYLRFAWRDERLRHEGGERLVYAEEAAVDKLKEIWWPQIEFVNTSKPEITNQTLEILPDGEVLLDYGLTGSFRAHLDLHRFPFDTQILVVRVQSFLSGESELVFREQKGRTGFQPANTFEGLRVTGVNAEVGVDDGGGWGRQFSEYRALIHVKRNSTFYAWTVFGPVALIFLISCTVYLVRADGLADRVGICLTALLACIATQFTLSFSLPQISYLTVIDSLFIATYAFIAVNVLLVSVEALRGDPTRRTKTAIAIAVPLAYILLVALLVLN